MELCSKQGFDEKQAAGGRPEEDRGRSVDDLSADER